MNTTSVLNQTETPLEDTSPDQITNMLTLKQKAGMIIRLKSRRLGNGQVNESRIIEKTTNVKGEDLPTDLTNQEKKDLSIPSHA